MDVYAGKEVYQQGSRLAVTEPITAFRGNYRFLSNFYPCPVEYEGALYPAAENAYQAAKTDREVNRAEFLSVTPAVAKSRGQRVELRPNWETVKLEVMMAVLRAKFSNPELRWELVQTGDAELVEGNDWGDRYWGTSNGTGENHLGKLLMKVRDEIYTSGVVLPQSGPTATDPDGWAFQRMLLDSAARLLREVLGREPVLYEVLHQLAQEERYFSPQLHAGLFTSVQRGQKFPCVFVVLTPEGTILLPALPLANSPRQDIERDLRMLRHDLRTALFDDAAARLRRAVGEDATSYHGLTF